MTEKEKVILVRALLAGLRLVRSKKDSTAQRYARQVADAVSDLMDECDKR